jgi:hypothetical protein
VTVPQSLEVCGCWVLGSASYTLHCYVGMTSRVSAASAAAVAAGYLERASLFVDHDQDAESKINL